MHPWSQFSRGHGLPEQLEGQTVVGIQVGFSIPSWSR